MQIQDPIMLMGIEPQLLLVVQHLHFETMAVPTIISIISIHKSKSFVDD
jgi:hypothetical protein